MKILLITTTYPTPVRPRQGSFVREMVRGLSVEHSIQVVAPIPWTQLSGSTRSGAQRSDSQRTEEQGLQAENQDSNAATQHHPVYYYPPKTMRTYYAEFYWLSIRKTVLRLAREFQPDVVMGYWAHPDGAAAIQAAKLCGVPCVIQVGGSDIRILSKQPGRGKKISQVLQRADRVIACSQELAKQVAAAGVPRHRIDVLYRGVDREIFKSSGDDAAIRQRESSDGTLVLWAGRFEQVKNPALFVELARRLVEKTSRNWRFAMLGDGSLRADMVELANRYGLSRRFEFPGAMPHHELAQWYRTAVATVVTSHSEGIPNVLLESLACGTPFVATDVGGIKEIATPGFDRLVKPDDVTSLTNAVLEVVESSSPSRRGFVPDDLATAGRQIARVLTQSIATASRASHPHQVPSSNFATSLWPLILRPKRSTLR